MDLVKFKFNLPAGARLDTPTMGKIYNNNKNSNAHLFMFLFALYE